MGLRNKRSGTIPIRPPDRSTAIFVKDIRIKGKLYKKGTLVPSFAFLQADGTTASGNWLYCNSYTEKGNMSARRSHKDAKNKIGLYPEFAWCWPVNRRIIYNRASVDPKGQPWDEKDWVVRFEGKEKKREIRVQEVDRRTCPTADGIPWKTRTDPNAAIPNIPLIMRKHGHGQIFGPGRADGPFPEHYEPLECPVEKNEFSSQMVNPHGRGLLHCRRQARHL